VLAKLKTLPAFPWALVGRRAQSGRVRGSD